MLNKKLRDVDKDVIRRALQQGSLYSSNSNGTRHGVHHATAERLVVLGYLDWQMGAGFKASVTYTPTKKAIDEFIDE